MMRRWLVASAGACVLAGSAQAIAEEKPQSITFVSGTCEALRIPGSDLTQRCLPQVMEIVEQDGGTKYMAMVGDERAVLLCARPDSAHSDAAMLSLSSIAVVGTQTTAGEEHDVTGSCRNSQLAASVRRIDCDATDGDGGRYEFRFASDGKTPTTTRF